MSGPAVAVETCARRLAPLGIQPSDSRDAVDGARSLVLDGSAGPGGDGSDLAVELSWYGPADVEGRRGSEAAVQAMSGLMQVHGRDAGGPRRLGLEIASATAGILASQGVLAAMVGRSRGAATTRLETSVLQAALLLVSHRVASATSLEPWIPRRPGPAPGPPFRSADGVWFEIETLDPSAWKLFWERLGAGGCDLEWAWSLFRPRYFRGTTSLPPGLHEAVSARPLAEIETTARDCAVSLRRVRGYEEVLEELGTWEGHPTVRPLSEAGKGHGAIAPPRTPAGDLPLSGLRVIEATSRLQGPLAGLLLRMLGAQVVRVEPPGGAPGRTVPPLLDDTGSFFLTFNRGKESVELDLGTPQGRDELVELAAGADVFLQNWRPEKAAEWRLDADHLAAVNPGLVYAHGSGWGEHPDAGRLVGTDFLVQAYSGVAAGLNPEGTPPLPSRALLTDYLGALNTCEAALAGLYQRERTGRGQAVGGSLLGGAMAVQAHVLEALAAGREKGRRGGRPLWSRLDHPLRTADGVIAVSVDDDEDLRRLSRACGLTLDHSTGVALEDRLAECLAGEVTAYWETRLTEAGLACAKAATDLAALPVDPRLSALFEPLAGPASVPAAPWRLVP